MYVCCIFSNRHNIDGLCINGREDTQTFRVLSCHVRLQCFRTQKKRQINYTYFGFSELILFRRNMENVYYDWKFNNHSRGLKPKSISAKLRFGSIWLYCVFWPFIGLTGSPLVDIKEFKNTLITFLSAFSFALKYLQEVITFLRLKIINVFFLSWMLQKYQLKHV